jgi:hypothetical protein
MGKETADLSTPLRFGRDDKAVGNRSSGFSPQARDNSPVLMNKM